MADLDAPQIKSRIVKRLRIPDEKIILMLADDMAVMNILLNHKLTGTEKTLRFCVVIVKYHFKKQVYVPSSLKESLKSLNKYSHFNECVATSYPQVEE
ncbi:unnamed protein product [Thlaspi arvense]|uniref:Uncharacterized protein n=1 Tax=Thlaspi arvense TaxID=13288 RepID=A0AAU9SJ20_THLAR|nr:unnamed protein product [Thlaspi arvense]